MFFSVSLYGSLAVFLIGLIYKVFTWFSRKIGMSARHISTSQRVSAAVKGILGVIFSSKILLLLKALILDVILQRRILREDFLRWLMHMLMYGGFMLLLLMHALDKIVTAAMFSDYSATLNPFMFLRDLFGLMTIVGLGIAIYRRFILKVPRLKTNAMDHYAIILMAVIMISGVLLEGVKITSHSVFQAMVEEYGDPDEEEEVKALESLWVRDFGVVSPNIKGPFDEETLEQGLEVHEMSCAGCHSAPQSAFTGYATAKILKPVALSLDRMGVVDILWYIHFLACFIGLAYLPFSKMFHIIASPVSLLANAVMDKDSSDPANIATRQTMELDACTHCGTCSLRCSSAPASKALGNEYILPSEKMVFLKALAAGKELDRTELNAIQEGIYVCTNCDRCTVVCPVGINLKELWINVREDLVQRKQPEPLMLSPFSFVRGLNRKDVPEKDYPRPIEGARRAVAGEFDAIMDKASTVNLEERGTIGITQLPESTFSYCFGCQNCTSVCPVVGSYEDPEEALGLLPHQIMCCLGLGLVEMASGPNMLWDCTTCYQCQEHCPQNVKVTDILYQLKNMVVRDLKRGDAQSPPVANAA